MDKNLQTVIICPIEKRFVGKLIGKGGTVINSLREKYGVRINYNDCYGRAVISGKKGACEDAERDIKSIIAEAEKSNNRRWMRMLIFMFPIMMVFIFRGTILRM